MKLRFVDTAALLILALAIAPVLRAQSANPPATAAQSATPANAPAQAHPAAPANASPAQPSSAAASPAAVAPLPKYFEVPSGTRLPLVLHNAISTRSAQPGDPVYLETLFPIVIDSRILIPAGSYVSGEVTEAKRPGTRSRARRNQNQTRQFDSSQWLPGQFQCFADRCRHWRKRVSRQGRHDQRRFEQGRRRRHRPGNNRCGRGPRRDCGPERQRRGNWCGSRCGSGPSCRASHARTRSGTAARHHFGCCHEPPALLAFEQSELHEPWAIIDARRSAQSRTAASRWHSPLLGYACLCSSCPASVFG